MLRLLSLFLFVATVTACSENFVFSAEQSVPAAEWKYADTLGFSIPIADTTKRYNLYLDIQHTASYAYQNIYLNVTTQYPSGKVVSELLPIDFADKTGHWFGDCDMDKCELRVNIQRNAFFNEMGTHRIIFEQYLRENPLSGIQSLALRMEEVPA